MKSYRFGLARVLAVMAGVMTLAAGSLVPVLAHSNRAPGVSTPLFHVTVPALPVLPTVIKSSTRISPSPRQSKPLPPPVPGGCNTYRPCPPTDDPPVVHYPKPQEPPTPGGCNTYRPCPPTDDNETCTKEDNCGADPADNEDNPPEQCHIYDACGAQQAPDSL